MHVSLPISSLPSRGVFYDNPPELIEIREMKFVEVEEMALTPFPKRFERLLSLFDRTDLLKGFPHNELTIPDFEYILLSICSITFPSLEYTFSTPCPKCKDNPKKLKLTIKGKEKEIILDFKAHAVVLPTQMAFKQLDEEIVPPIEVELSSGIYKVDYPRIKHYSILQDIAKELNIPVSQVPITHSKLLGEVIPGLDIDSLTVDDWEILNGLYLYLNHDIETEYKAKCKACGTVVPITVEWEVIDLYPFRGSKADWRDKVRFGKGVAPTNKRNSRNGIPKSDRPLPSVNIDTE